MADAVAKLAKPEMRRLLHNSIKKQMSIAFGLSFAAALLFKFTVQEPRKAKYAEFYRTYDAEKVFNEMRQKGLFQSCE